MPFPLPAIIKRSLLALAVALPAACGAGIVTGGIVSNRNNNDPPPEVRPPELSLPEPTVPMVPSEGEGASLRTVIVSNLEQLPSGPLSVEIRALGVTDVQGSPVPLAGQGATTVIGYLLRTANIRRAVGDPTSRDVTGELAVLANGVEVAPPVPLQLLRQPVAGLEPPQPGATEQFLSPQGGTPVTLRISGLRSTRAEDLLMSVSTPDAGGAQEPVIRPCTNLTLQPQPGGDALVAADVPGNLFPGQATLIVDDAIAGRSTAVTDVYYRPDILTALPRQGPTTGGTLLTLIGRALVPLDFSANPPAPDFDRIRIRFEKGAPLRELHLDPIDLRTAASSLDRLVFTMPPSPDGRPGEVDIILEADLGPVLAQVSTNVFTFANPQPVFGPRGAVLDRRPVASVPIRLEGAPGGNDAPDFAFLFEEGGVSFVQLFVAAENGMFSRFSAPRQIGDPQNPGEVGPVALGAGDFDGDSVPDLLVINRGAGTTARHQVILGQPAPRPPLGPVAARVDTIGGNFSCRSVDIDGDGLLDLVFLPGLQAPAGSRPQVFLSRPAGIGAPAFAQMADVPIRAGPYDAMTVTDLDGDGFVDVAVMTGGSAPTLDIAYGLGDGTFVSGSSQQLDLDIPNYVPDAASPGVGVHAAGAGFPRALAVVMAGVAGSMATPPVVASLHSQVARIYEQPTAGDVLNLPGTEPFETSITPDMDEDGVPELIVALEGETAAFPLILGQWQGSRFQVLGNAIDFGAEQLLSITALHFGVAFPPEPGSGQPGVRALFVVHESEVDGFRERRLSTMLATNSPSLLAPDAGGQLPVPLLGQVGGIFSQIAAASEGSTVDLALGLPIAVGPGNGPGIRLLLNDGNGGFFSPGLELPLPAILPQTIAEAEVDGLATNLSSLVFFTDDGRLGVWTPDQPAERLTPDLRSLSPKPRHATTLVSSTSRVLTADVDGDGLRDLIVLLVFDEAAPTEGDALLLILRGKPSVQLGEFPFHVPVAGAVETVHGSSADFALGDLAPSTTGTPTLEVAVAVPLGTTPSSQDGNHVRFFRYVAGATPAEDRFEQSFADPAVQVLLGGDEPTQVEAADFDGNGTIDLLAASNGDSSLRFFLNSGAPGGDPREVNIAAFREGLTSPKPLAPGMPTFLDLGDVNGDGTLDALVMTSESGPPRNTVVAFYLSSGTGEFSLPTFLSQTRVGNPDAVVAVDLADYNGDRQLDLSSVWAIGGSGERNVRVLFGGSR